jgi:hypothetical protein
MSCHVATQIHSSWGTPRVPDCSEVDDDDDDDGGAGAGVGDGGDGGDGGGVSPSCSDDEETDMRLPVSSPGRCCSRCSRRRCRRWNQSRVAWSWRSGCGTREAPGAYRALLLLPRPPVLLPSSSLVGPL